MAAAASARGIAKRRACSVSVSRTVMADLFSGRHEILDVLRWKEIYGRLENAADKCEDVANAIESIVVKSR